MVRPPGQPAEVVRWSGAPLVINVQAGTWRFTIHHADCGQYLRSDPRNRNRPVAPGMRMIICGSCKPDEELVEAFLPSVVIDEFSHGGIGHLQRSKPRTLNP